MAPVALGLLGFSLDSLVRPSCSAREALIQAKPGIHKFCRCCVTGNAPETNEEQSILLMASSNNALFKLASNHESRPISCTNSAGLSIGRFFFKHNPLAHSFLEKIVR
jgi:hypothetical protein